MADRTNTSHGENAIEEPGRMEQILSDLVRELRQQNNRENRRTNANPIIQASLTERFIKLQPPTFARAPKADEVETWIMGMENIFEVMECPEDKKVTLTAFRLQGEAKSGSVGVVVAELNLEAITRVAWGRVCAGGNFLSNRVGD
ncbi:hypothetical protein F0562_015557 [Nyssa sinensis]|uniref:Uncharacterized protein n=1 Tax=Nyssa sinensis TaxID=561372 RepID=A0A5J4ZHB2_9ASTE|nr:hypothetical protein F0562_015557 [Nyssa sinensis]